MTTGDRNQVDASRWRVTTEHAHYEERVTREFAASTGIGFGRLMQLCEELWREHSPLHGMGEPALEQLESAPSEPPAVAMIAPGSTWTLALCNDAASKVVAEHGLVVHGYIVGSAHGSAVRFHLLRDGVVVLHVQLGIDELEACGDEAAVRAAVTGRIAGVIEYACERGYDVRAESSSK